VSATMKSQQRGRLVLGLGIGLLAGVALSLAVALYVTKVPVPFIDKVPHRTPEQDAAELEKNRNWDPNAALAGKNPMRPASAPAAAPALATQAPAASAPPAPAARTAAAVPSTRPGADPFIYFVQAGAFGRAEDADQQRARLGLLGFAARITEREQSGRTVYRVRLGPFDKKDEADAARERLDGNGVEAALVRVQRPER